ncbi:MAG: hypothetical protein ACLGXA_24400 [Acidobacteriota bacterium]
MVIDVAPEYHQEIQSLHAAGGLDYRLPDLESPLLIVKKAVTNEKGEVIGACLLRLTAETMLVLSPELSPREKMDAMEAMQPEVLNAAWSLGLDDIEARIPEESEQIFEKRLNQLGWSRDRDGWHPWSRSTNA